VLTIILVGCCYSLLLWGWWVPVVPAFLVLMLNGIGFTAALFYRHEQELRLRLEERQFVIEQTFNAIHSGPLQSLVGILRTARDQNISGGLLLDLQRLNQELRDIYGSVQQETNNDELSLPTGGMIGLALQAPLHELLYKVYCNTLERDLPYLRTIQHKIVQFDALDSRRLPLKQKRGLCRFLEEALCNVGKHAQGATRLTVICTQEGDEQVIRVMDNGDACNPIASDSTGLEPSKGMGTQLANNLAKQLGGTFRRDRQHPKGMMCELRWSARRKRFW
jgi:anti-sigma regulatory factor (Ser/Thr protein kinase)